MEERGLTPLLEQVFSLYRLPTLGESPQRKRLPGLSVTLITGGKKGKGRKLPTAQQRYQSLRLS